MPAAEDGNSQLLLAPELHRRHDVGHVGAARDQSRAPVDHRVVYLASRVVTRIVWLDQSSVQAGSEIGNGRFVQHRYSDLRKCNCVTSQNLRNPLNLAGIFDLDSLART